MKESPATQGFQGDPVKCWSCLFSIIGKWSGEPFLVRSPAKWFFMENFDFPMIFSFSLGTIISWGKLKLSPWHGWWPAKSINPPSTILAAAQDLRFQDQLAVLWNYMVSSIRLSDASYALIRSSDLSGYVEDLISISECRGMKKPPLRRFHISC